MTSAAGNRSGVSGGTRAWLHDGAAGAVVAAVTVAYAVAYSAVIYSGSLADGIGAGLAASLLSSGMCAIVVALGSSLPLAIGAQDTPPTAILAAMAASLAALPVATPLVILLVALTSVVTGAVLLLFGTAGIGRAIRFVPYPVVGGFLAASGALLTLGAVRVLTGTHLSMATLPLFLQASPLAHLAAGAAVAALLFGAVRLRHPLALVGALVLTAVAVHAALLAAGIDRAHARSAGWLFDVPGSAALTNVWDLAALAAVPWSLLPAVAGEVLALVIVTAISILMNASALEIQTRADADVNRELRVNGIANMLAGAAGGPVTSLTLNRSLLNVRAGAVSRRSGIIAGLACVLLATLGTGGAGLLPRPVVGGLLLFMGLGLLGRWAWRAAATMSRGDALVVLAIFSAVLQFGFMAGLVIGIAAALALFAVKYARIRAIRDVGTARDTHSRVEWAPADRALLHTHGHQVRVVWLHGFIFFGSAHALLETVRLWLDAPADERVGWIVLDFSHVPGIDSSAALSFAKLAIRADAVGTDVLFATMSPSIDRALRIAGVFDASSRTHRCFDLDVALELCETALLARHGSTGPNDDRFHEWLLNSIGDPVRVRRLLDAFEPVHLAPGDVLFHQDDPSDSLYFIARGRISVIHHRDDRPVRLRSMVDCTVVGEMGLFRDAPRTATVRADTHTLAYRVTRRNLAALEQTSPRTALDLNALVLRILADRLSPDARTLEGTRPGPEPDPLDRLDRLDPDGGSGR